MQEDRMKEAAARAAAMSIPPGIALGVGSGSTVNAFLLYLGRRCTEEGLSIRACAASKASHRAAEEAGIPLFDEGKLPGSLDLTVDGADVITPNRMLLKGGGGALLREKILARMSPSLTLIVDTTKCLEKMSGQPLPLEILPFGYRSTLRQIHAMGLSGRMRRAGQNLYLTDNGNFIYDLSLPEDPDMPALDEALIALPGLLATGFFPPLPGITYVGEKGGEVSMVPYRG
ncbi:MAG: ribose 5-phosphate isomerase A [Chlamydiota bacterium]|nr:ribose 5-phosphate isomerase A [Chlamydiota bacterium]